MLGAVSSPELFHADTLAESKTLGPRSRHRARLTWAEHVAFTEAVEWAELGTVPKLLALSSAQDGAAAEAV